MINALWRPRANRATGTRDRQDLILNAALLTPALLLIVLVFLLPLVLVLANSVVTPEGVSLFYFRKFFSDPYYLSVLWRTFRLGFMSVIATLIPGYILAYNMVFHPSRRFRLLIVAVTMIPLVIDLLIRLFGWIAILSSAGTIHELFSLAGLTGVRARLLYSESAIVIGLTHSYMTFMVLPIATALSKIEPSLLRAAQNLGAGPWKCFRRVLLPLSMSGVVAGCLLCFALDVSDFVTPNLLGGERLPTMTYLIYENQLFLANDSFAAAQTVILMAMSLASVFGGLRLAVSFGRRFAA